MTKPRPRLLLSAACGSLLLVPASCNKNLTDPSGNSLRVGGPMPLQLQVDGDRIPSTLPIASSATLGDLDGDGIAELVTTDAKGTRVLQNDRRGRFAEPAALPALPAATHRVVLLDIEGDGDLDLFRCTAGQDHLYLNDGRTAWRDVTATNLPPSIVDTRAAVAADVDGDGDADLLCGAWGQQNRLLINQGGRFTDVSSTQLPADRDSTAAVVLVDVDGDLDLDAVLGNAGGPNRLYENTGGGRFVDAPGRLPIGNETTTGIAAGDVDADGDVDLVIGSVQRGARLLLGDGRGSFTAGRDLPFGPGDPGTIHLVDFDEDGDLDLLLGGDRGLRMLTNDGTGGFEDHSASKLPSPAGEVRVTAVADIDADQDVDVFWAGRQRQGLWVNVQRQLVAPASATAGQPFEIFFYARTTGADEHPQTITLYLNVTDLTPMARVGHFGRFGLATGGLLRLPPILATSPGGLAKSVLEIPDDPALSGRILYLQAVIAHEDDIGTWRLTHVAEAPISR